jgi:P27 family predicted phage terminase small subunit
MKGRKPNLVVLEGGNARGKCPAPPTWLSDKAKAEWRRVAPELHARKLLAADTRATLESYCVATGLVQEAEERMAVDGRLIQSSKGLVPHPAFKMQLAAMREARLLAAELGLTPHRRGTKGDANDKEAGDDWGGLLA